MNEHTQDTTANQPSDTVLAAPVDFIRANLKAVMETFALVERMIDFTEENPSADGVVASFVYNELAGDIMEVLIGPLDLDTEVFTTMLTDALNANHDRLVAEVQP